VWKLKSSFIQEKLYPLIWDRLYLHFSSKLFIIQSHETLLFNSISRGGDISTFELYKCLISDDLVNLFADARDSIVVKEKVKSIEDDAAKLVKKISESDVLSSVVSFLDDTQIQSRILRIHKTYNSDILLNLRKKKEAFISQWVSFI
jgi:hypothetical protein